MPEIWRGSIELYWSVKAFRHGLSAANHFAGDAFFGAGMFENQACSERQALFQYEKCAIVIDADCGCFEGGGLALERDVNAGADAQEYTLAAAPVVIRERRSTGRVCRFRRSERFCSGHRFRWCGDRV